MHDIDVCLAPQITAMSIQPRGNAIRVVTGCPDKNPPRWRGELLGKRTKAVHRVAGWIGRDRNHCHVPPKPSPESGRDSGHLRRDRKVLFVVDGHEVDGYHAPLHEVRIEHQRPTIMRRNGRVRKRIAVRPLLARVGMGCCTGRRRGRDHRCACRE